MSTPTLIADHNSAALARLLYQFQDKVRLQATLAAANMQFQDLEQMLFDLLEDRWIETAVGIQLDRWGAVLNEPRFGLADDDYRIQLVAKVAQNNSETTAEDLISMFKILTRAQYVVFQEYFPAEVSLTAVNANPIGDTTRIRAVLNKAKAAGVDINAAIVTAANVFSFEGDPDPNSLGFGDANDASLGGQWANII